jgi:hypothetical protein
MIHIIAYIQSCYPSSPIRLEYFLHMDVYIKDLRLIISNDINYSHDIFDIVMLKPNLILDDALQLHNYFIVAQKNVITIERKGYDNSPENNQKFRIYTSKLTNQDVFNPFYENIIEKNINESELCIICYERRYNMLFTKCRHMCVCERCCKKITRCPKCRGDITNKEKLSNIPDGVNIFLA